MYLSGAEYVGPFLTSGALHIFFPWPVISLGSAPWVHIFPQTSEFPRTSPKHTLNLPAVLTLPIISLFSSSAPTHSAQGASFLQLSSISLEHGAGRKCWSLGTVALAGLADE